MSSRTCPEWPRLMEVAAELQFKHHTLAEAQLPAEAMMHIDEVGLDEVAICCDLESHVFNAAHTHPQIVRALSDTHWFEVREWVVRSSGSRS